MCVVFVVIHEIVTVTAFFKFRVSQQNQRAIYKLRHLSTLRMKEKKIIRTRKNLALHLKNITNALQHKNN